MSGDAHPSVVDRVKVGNTFRAIRLELRLRQVDVAERAGISQQTVSDLECGHLGGLSVDAYCRIAAALDADIPLAPRWRGPKLDRILDRRHALLQNRMVELLTASGWSLATESPFNRYGDRGSVDVLGWRPERRALLIVEIKSEITSLEETLRVLNMKRRVVPIAMHEERGWEARHLAALLVLPDATTHRLLVKRHNALVSASLPDRGWDVRHWLNDPSGELRGLMFLPNTGRGGAMRKAPASRRVRRARAAGPGPKDRPHDPRLGVIERAGGSHNIAKPPPEPAGSPSSSPSSV